LRTVKQRVIPPALNVRARQDDTGVTSRFYPHAEHLRHRGMKKTHRCPTRRVPRAHANAARELRRLKDGTAGLAGRAISLPSLSMPLSTSLISSIFILYMQTYAGNPLFNISVGHGMRTCAACTRLLNVLLTPWQACCTCSVGFNALAHVWHGCFLF